MIQRYKGVVALIEDWESTNKVIPEELWAVVVLEGTERYPLRAGIKLGSGRRYSDTPFIVDPRWWDAKIPKPLTETPSSEMFLAEDGEYYLLDTGKGLTLNDIQIWLAENNLEITSTEEVAWVRAQMYKIPVFESFQSGSQFIGVVQMNTLVSGNIGLAWTLLNPENILETTLSASEGDWTGLGLVTNPLTARNKVVTLTTPITSQQIKTITLTLSGKDSRGAILTSRQLHIRFTHRIFWGTALTREITSLESITGLSSILSNDRKHTLQFTPSGNQYSVILIPSDIPQQGINIVNVNIGNSDHSYMMNEGSGPTIHKSTLIHQGVLYNAYVSFNASNGPSKAEIK
jgi:hypothetical protein